MARYDFDANSPVIAVDVLFWDVAEALNLQPALCEKRVDIITASGVEKAPLLNVDSVRFIDKKADKVDVLIHDLPPKSYIDGLLGLSFLRKFNLHINFKESYLQLE